MSTGVTMATTTEVHRGRTAEMLPRLVAIVALVGVGAACGDRVAPPPAHAEESWSVTAWGELYEVFPEVDPLIAGQAAEAHTHVTVLDGFAPLAEGGVEIVLRGEGGSEERFVAEEAARPGIFTVAVTPRESGERDLFFRIRSPAGREEIRGGRVRVGDAATPGGMVRAPAPRGATDGGTAIPFLKEEQWRGAFATAWVREGALAQSVRGLARVRPPAGGEATVTATVAGVLASRPWPYPGAPVAAGAALFRIAPEVASERSMADLAAEERSLEAEHQAARARLARLEDLIALEATSERELAEARTRVAMLDARLTAARSELAGARAMRDGHDGGETHTVRAPFTGHVATVAASPGSAVAAGAPLARLVRTDVAWLEIDLAPADARRLAGEVIGVVVEADGEADAAPPRRFVGEEVRLVSIAPEADPTKGTVTALVEVASPGLVLGTVADVEVLLAGERTGIVVPRTAVIDDAGVPVVYLQLAGETFVRQAVTVEARQGDRLLVSGLVPGQRLVTRGGADIRRASLMASGEPAGHVH